MKVQRKAGAGTFTAAGRFSTTTAGERYSAAHKPVMSASMAMLVRLTDSQRFNKIPPMIGPRK
jgi:hypothetical protein